ncbi:hypothetical protein [Spirosoma validum]|uniref:Uncharacterized protein n=1 Tax=Spirosoma validum TaxID=2771355 RepID=A0A927B479_9BACT|nr:hypothetical protein [Spirosoma validum]MBD2754981.1 hypothetical protein [Spirosoma validum]
MTPNNSLPDLLERYVFAVAARFVESTSPADQTRLINLYNSIGKPMLDSNPAAPALHTATELGRALPLPETKTQQKNTVTRPPRKKLVLTESLQALGQRSLAMNQQQIKLTQSYILQMEMLIIRTQSTIKNASLRAQLLKHYQGIRESYLARLEQLEAFQAIKLSKFYTVQS